MFNRVKINNEYTDLVVYKSGAIFNLKSGKFVVPHANPAGYMYISYYWKKKKKMFAVHRLVAQKYIPNPENKPQVNHKDGNKKNNAVTNLEWVTPKENNIHAYSTGLHKAPSGENVHFAKYSAKMVKLACEKMAEDKISLYEIERLTGIPHKTLCDIRKGNIWKDISRNYKFPDNHVIASRIGLDYETNKKIKELVWSGKKNNEIYEIIGLEKKNKRLTNMMNGVRYAHMRKSLKTK